MKPFNIHERSLLALSEWFQTIPTETLRRICIDEFKNYGQYEFTIQTYVIQTHETDFNKPMTLTAVNVIDYKRVQRKDGCFFKHMSLVEFLSKIYKQDKDKIQMFLNKIMLILM